MCMRIKRDILRHTEGATVIEYAIVLPILLLLIMGIVEYSTIMYGMAVLEGATITAAREGSTGYINATSTGTCPSPVVNGQINVQSQATYINCLVGAHSNGLFNSTKLQISYNDTNSNSFSSTTDAPTFPTGPCTNNPALANPPSFPMCAENSQSAGDIVIYTVTYPWPIYTPILRSYLGNNGTFTLTSSTIVKNEPYSTSSSR